MGTMIFAGQTAAFAKSARTAEDAYYCQQRPRARRFPHIDVIGAIALALIALGAVSRLVA